MIAMCKYCENTATMGHWDDKETWKRPLTCEECGELEQDCECWD